MRRNWAGSIRLRQTTHPMCHSITNAVFVSNIFKLPDQLQFSWAFSEL